MEPLATYRETRFDGRRTFRLYEDRLDIAGTTFLQNRFEISVPLATIDPIHVARLFVRNRNFFGGLHLAVWPAVALELLLGHFGMEWDSLPAGLCGMLVFAGLALMACTWRKVEFLYFINRNGVTRFDIARKGPDAVRFDDFIAALKSRIPVAP